IDYQKNIFALFKSESKIKRGFNFTSRWGNAPGDHTCPVRKIAIIMSWEDFKILTREEFCPSNEMQNLETELWNHAMVGASHAAYTDRFHELARLVPHLVTPEATKPKTIQKTVQIADTLTDEALRNETIKKNLEKRGNRGEPSKN
ncbi:reverse transcriptase domain-containing protein, partial [Tanacetum coccineum]